jgi:1-acyl-sn-glycerol-3-phosphate acyltransferase
MRQKKITSHISPWVISPLYPLTDKIILPLYFKKVEITGQENVPLSGPVLVAPTHRSRWDAVIVPYATGRLVSGRDLRFMVMASEMKGFQGCLIRHLGGFPVNLERPGPSTLRHSVELLLEGEMVVVFPEGGIFRDNEVHPLKRGAARIALEVEAERLGSGIKILPISVKYSQPFPSWGTEIRVKIGQPLDVAPYQGEKIKQSTKQLTAVLETTLKELHQDPVESKPIANVSADPITS